MNTILENIENGRPMGFFAGLDNDGLQRIISYSHNYDLLCQNVLKEGLNENYNGVVAICCPFDDESEFYSALIELACRLGINLILYVDSEGFCYKISISGSDNVLSVGAKMNLGEFMPSHLIEFIEHSNP